MSQWRKWSIPSKHTTLGLLVGVAALVLTVALFRLGPTAAKQDETLAIVKRMERVQSENDEQLLKRFPLGYVLFTATLRKEIIPLDPKTKDFEVDWHSAKVVEITEERVIVQFPDFVYRPSNWRVYQNTVGLFRQKGARSGGMVSIGRHSTAVEIIHNDADGVIIALGLVPF